MAIDLSSAYELPTSILTRLRPFERLFRQAESIEQLLGEPSIAAVVADLDKYCLSSGVVGHHYTRAIRCQIESRGLQLFSGEERRRHFLREYADRFTSEQGRQIESRWQEYFDATQNAARDGCIAFNLTLEELNRGADRLLRYFGGEMIYMPLTSLPEIASILESIGEPKVVSVELEPARCSTYHDQAWGKAWLSAYHITLSPNAVRLDQDVRVREAIGPKRIISIHSATQLGWMGGGK